MTALCSAALLAALLASSAAQPAPAPPELALTALVEELRLGELMLDADALGVRLAHSFTQVDRGRGLRQRADFQPRGYIAALLGEPGAEGRAVLDATGVYIDEQDRIYVADSYNGRVQIFQYLGASTERK